MKTFSKLLVLTLIIASVSSCKKDAAVNFPGQKPDFSYQPQVPTRAVIEVRNECLDKTNKIYYVLLSDSDTVGITHPIDINSRKEFTTSVYGEVYLSVIVESSGNNSITVTDSEGEQYYQSITVSGRHFGVFNKINVSDKSHVIVTYR